MRCNQATWATNKQSRTVCLNAGSTLKFFSNKLCVAIHLNLSTSFTIQLLLFVSGSYLTPMNCSSLLCWLLRPKRNTLLVNCWLLRPRGKKKFFRQLLRPRTKKKRRLSFTTQRDFISERFCMGTNSGAFDLFVLEKILIFPFLSWEGVFSVYYPIN